MNEFQSADQEREFVAQIEQNAFNNDAKELVQFLKVRDGAARLLEALPNLFEARTFQESRSQQRFWECIGLFYFNSWRREAEALAVFSKMYDYMLQIQEQLNTRIHKAVPLLWMAESFSKLGCGLLRKRYLMLALCEDAISGGGRVSPESSGVYFRLIWRLGMTDVNLQRYAKKFYEESLCDAYQGRFPERLLLTADQEWMSEFPSPAEANIYIANTIYINRLLEKLGEGTGTTLEELAEYLLVCMPGCQTSRRKLSYSTDYDVVCSMNGFDLDFRSEFGRYFVCECKDWSSPAGFSELAKFCRVLDSVKAKFGILFSKNGITGELRTTDAKREQLKIFQDREMVIIVFEEQDIRHVANGANFISRLRDKYERVRLDVRGSSGSGD